MRSHVIQLLRDDGNLWIVGCLELDGHFLNIHFLGVIFEHNYKFKV
jgi:hypothetical protein